MNDSPESDTPCTACDSGTDSPEAAPLPPEKNSPFGKAYRAYDK